MWARSPSTHVNKPTLVFSCCVTRPAALSTGSIYGPNGAPSLCFTRIEKRARNRLDHQLAAEGAIDLQILLVISCCVLLQCCHETFGVKCMVAGEHERVLFTVQGLAAARGDIGWGQISTVTALT